MTAAVTEEKVKYCHLKIPGFKQIRCCLPTCQGCGIYKRFMGRGFESQPPVTIAMDQPLTILSPVHTDTREPVNDFQKVSDIRAMIQELIQLHPEVELSLITVAAFFYQRGREDEQESMM